MGENEVAGPPDGIGRSLLVLYGSETGHGQEIAEEIGDVAERLRWRVLVEVMNDVPLKELFQHSLVVFVTSTTGQGDMPDNANIFWKSLLRKKLPPDCLRSLHFTTFGLGDSSYEKFNWAARKLRKRLLQLSASEFLPSGEGDERHDNGIDSIYLPWFQGLKAHLLNDFPLPVNLTVIPDDELLPPKYPITLVEMGSKDASIQESHWKANRDKNAALSHIRKPKTMDEELDDQERRLHDLKGLGQYARADDDLSDRLTGSRIEGIDRVQLDKDNILKDHAQEYDLDAVASGEPGASSSVSSSRHIPVPRGLRAKVHRNRRVTPNNHWQDVRQLELQICDDEFVPTLMPGDLVTIYPKNFEPDVSHLIDMMKWNKIAYIPIVWDTKNEVGNIRRPRGLYTFADATLFHLLLHNLDINAIPNRTFLKQLRRHTKDEREKERLLELTLEENTQEFYDYTSRPRRTILEVLEDFPGVKIPFEYVLDIFPVIRGRAFSIANSKKAHRDRKASFRDVTLLVALVEYKTIIRKPRQGLCSRYIRSLKEGASISVTFSRTSPPPSSEWDASRPLLAVATGTGIAPIRSLLQERRTWGLMNGHELLFFGCRSKNADFYYKDEWIKDSQLQVIPAFSRDPINPTAEAELDPYAVKKTRLADPEKPLSADLTRMGPRDSPWVRSTEYDRGKMYVQHQIRRHAHDVCRIFQEAFDRGVVPIIMICGNAGRMPISVRHALADALVLGGLRDDYEEARKLLQETGIWMETW